MFEGRSVTVGLVDVELPSGLRVDHYTVTIPPASMTVVLEPNVGMLRNAHHVFLARGAERVGEARS